MLLRRTPKEISSQIRLFFSSRLRSKGVILAYNSTPTQPIDSKEFVRQMHYIRQSGRKVIPLSEMCEMLKEKKSIHKHIVITFDTVHVDFFTHTFPALRRNNFPSTVFVTSSLLGKEVLPEGKATRIISADDIRRASSANELIEFMPHGEGEELLARLNTQEAIEEVKRSRRLVEKLTGKVADIFAYPRGVYTDDLVEYLKGKDEWLGAVTLEAGTVTKSSDPFLLKRIVVDKNVSFSDFKKILS